MPVPRRIARLAQLIHEVAAQTVQQRLRDPRIGFVTITRVKLAPDMTEATVYWSALGTDAQRRTSARPLVDATPVVQAIVAKALGTRTTPTLSFRFDPTIAEAARLDGIFAKLRAERGEPAEALPGDEVAAEESAPPAEGEE